MQAVRRIRNAATKAPESLLHRRSPTKTTSARTAICARGKSKILIHQACRRTSGIRLAKIATKPKMARAMFTVCAPAYRYSIAIYGRILRGDNRQRGPTPAAHPRGVRVEQPKHLRFKT